MTLNVAPYLREDALLVPLVGKKSKCAAHTGKQLGEKRGEQRTVDEGTRLFFLLLSLFLIRLLHLATVSSRATATAGTPDDVRSPGLYWLISVAISVFALPPFHFLFLFLVLTSFHVLIRTRRRERSAVWNYYGMELELL